MRHLALFSARFLEIAGLAFETSCGLGALPAEDTSVTSDDIAMAHPDRVPTVDCQACLDAFARDMADIQAVFDRNLADFKMGKFDKKE